MLLYIYTTYKVMLVNLFNSCTSLHPSQFFLLNCGIKTLAVASSLSCFGEDGCYLVLNFFKNRNTNRSLVPAA